MRVLDEERAQAGARRRPLGIGAPVAMREQQDDRFDRPVDERLAKRARLGERGKRFGWLAAALGERMDAQ